MALMYIVPSPPPRPSTTRRWTGYEAMSLIDPETGAEWDLLQGHSGLYLLKEGCQGLGMPPFDEYTSEPAGADGELVLGHRVKPRPVKLPLYLFARDGSEAFAVLEDQFWTMFRPGKHLLWRVKKPGMPAATLSFRFGSDNDYSLNGDPYRRGSERYLIGGVAGLQPLWQLDPVVERWDNEQEQPFFVEPPSTAVLHISSASTVASATLTNTGEAVHGVWTIQGPVEAAELGEGPERLIWPIPLAAGEYVRIDTATQTVTDSAGTIRDGDLQGSDFLKIPARSTRRVPLQMTQPGPGSFIQVEYTPLRLRA